MSDGAITSESTTPNLAPAAARYVMVISTGPMQAFVQSLASAKAIRNHHVRARISLLTVPEFAPLAEACPFFDEVDTDGKPGMDPANIAKLVQRIRKAKFDMVYDLDGGADSSRLYQLLRPYPPKWSGPVEGASHRFSPPGVSAMHPLDRLARQLTEVGIGPPDGYAPGKAPLPDLSWVKSALRNTPRLRPSHFGLSGQFLLLSPSAAAKGPLRWSAGQYAELAKLIATRGVTPVITGAQEERGLGAEIAGADSRIKNVIGRADVFQQVALAESANFAIGDDTELMHVAAAAGAPLLLFYPASVDQPERRAPRSRAGMAHYLVRDFKDLTPEEVDKALLALGAYTLRK